MNGRKFRTLALSSIFSILGIVLAGCGDAKNDPNAGAPPPLKIESAEDSNVFQVARRQSVWARN